MVKKWSQTITNKSNSLDLEEGVFTWKDPHKIALSLKRSAEQSTRKTVDPYRSAMSMINFYINRAGKNIVGSQLITLESAKTELKQVFKK
jgi:hypothetical protein